MPLNLCWRALQAIQIGTYNFIDPAISMKVIDGIEDYLKRHKLNSVSEIIGRTLKFNYFFCSRFADKIIKMDICFGKYFTN